jgi:hypothetical protein
MKHSPTLTALALLLLVACATHPQAEPDAGDVLVRSLEKELVPTALEGDVTLPLELYEDKYLFVQGIVNGTPTDIVVDSGAGITVVDRAFADALGRVDMCGAGRSDQDFDLAPGPQGLDVGLALVGLRLALEELLNLRRGLRGTAPCHPAASR